jgi:hypothetical protein
MTTPPNKKPAVALRKPPVDPKAAERFVAGAVPAGAPSNPPSKPSRSRGATAGKAPPPAPRKRGRAIVVRTDGRELARKTVYLPPSLARRLAIYAAETEADVSGVITAICAAFLDARDQKLTKRSERSGSPKLPKR